MKTHFRCLAFLVMLAAASPAWAESFDVECVQGYCDGWHIWYEMDSSTFRTFNDYKATFHFDNQTGIPAFNVKYIVNCYDDRGAFLGRMEGKSDGPVNKFITFNAIVPKGSVRMTAELYWTESYSSLTGLNISQSPL
jgi:hypothetical protein